MGFNSGFKGLMGVIRCFSMASSLMFRFIILCSATAVFNYSSTGFILLSATPNVWICVKVHSFSNLYFRRSISLTVCRNPRSVATHEAGTDDVSFSIYLRSPEDVMCRTSLVNRYSPKVQIKLCDEARYHETTTEDIC